MFIDETLKKYKVDEKELSIGDIEVNTEIIKGTKFLRPFIRNKEKQTVIKIGSRNYEVLNAYIIQAMNDYYNRLINADENQRNMMSQTYNRLYEMWKELHNFKKSNNLVEMDKVYDLFTYELYVLGYEN